MVNSEVQCYVDGACSGNPGKGGWAAILVRGKNETVITGHDPDTTNNRMELMAAISALEMLRKGEVAVINSDSKYVVEGLTKWLPGWKKRGWVTSTNTRVANRDLWIRLERLVEEHRVKFVWMRGHSTYLIDLADQYAKEQTRV